MSRIVYIGVDGGGTKTSLCAADSGGRIFSACEGFGMNYNFVGVKKAAADFLETVGKLSLTEECKIAGIAIGDPSVDDLVPSPMTEEFVACVKTGLHLETQCPVYLKSDAFMALYGMTGGAPGALMISGTGSMGIAVDRRGAIHITGGWGRLTEDEGSGYYIAVNGIKAALRCYDGTGPETVLLEKFRKYFGTDNPRKFIAAYYAGCGSFPEIFGFSKEVGDAAENDREAEKIVHACADILIAGMGALLKKADLSQCTAGIYGSVLLHNTQIRNRFKEGILKKYPDVKIEVPSVKPEMAALKYMFDRERKR